MNDKFDDYDIETELERLEGRVKCRNCLRWEKPDNCLVVDQKDLTIWCLECIDKEDLR